MEQARFEGLLQSDVLQSAVKELQINHMQALVDPGLQQAVLQLIRA